MLRNASNHDWDYCSHRMAWPREYKFQLMELNSTDFTYSLTSEVLRSGQVRGNVLRTKRILNKLKNKDAIQVVSLGGSFARGHGCGETDAQAELTCAWPSRARQRLQTMFPESRINWQNFADHGNDALQLLNRLATLAYTTTDVPDLLIVDTLVNDLVSGVRVATAAYEKLIRASMSLFPDTQLLLVEDGCPECLADKSVVDQRRKIAQYYNIPVVDYAAMVERHNHVNGLSDALWPFSEPEYAGTPWTQMGAVWPNFVPQVNVTKPTCCATSHPPWPVHEYMADAVMHMLSNMLVDACDAPSSEVEMLLPKPFQDQQELDRFPACEKPLSFYSSQDPSGPKLKLQPMFKSGDWELCEDIHDRPGWIATEADSTIVFPIRFGSSGVLSVSYLKSYENVGLAELSLQSRGGTSFSGSLDGRWDNKFSLPASDMFINQEDGTAGGLIGKLAKADAWDFRNETGPRGYDLKIRMKSGSKFKIFSVASC